MPIRFRCPKCGQKLRASDGHSGTRLTCPRCAADVIVPAAEPAAVAVPPLVPPAIPASLAPEQLPRIVVHDDEVEWPDAASQPVYDRDPRVDFRKISVPRRVIYVQGILLAAVGLASFGIGFLARGSYLADRHEAAAPAPCVLSGRVTSGDEPDAAPLADCVVVALPADRRPPAEGRVAFEGFRPGDPVPQEGHDGIRIIRGLGGDARRSDADGGFRLQLSDQGEYYLLVISSRSASLATHPPERKDVAQLGRYFRSPLELLGDRPYRWERLTVRRDQTQDVEF